MIIKPEIEATSVSDVCESVRKIDDLPPVHTSEGCEDLPGCLQTKPDQPDDATSGGPAKSASIKGGGFDDADTTPRGKTRAALKRKAAMNPAPADIMTKAYALLDGLIDPDYQSRLTATQAMKHRFFDLFSHLPNIANLS